MYATQARHAGAVVAPDFDPSNPNPDGLTRQQLKAVMRSAVDEADDWLTTGLMRGRALTMDEADAALEQIATLMTYDAVLRA